MRKYSIMLLITAAVIIEVIGGVQYFMARQGAREDLLAQAQLEIQENQHVAKTKAEAESVVRNLMPNVLKVINNPEIYTTLTAHILKINPNIVGAGVAFIPDFYKEKGFDRLYAPYAFDDRPANVLLAKNKGKANVHFIHLGFDYTGREWYTVPQNENKSIWTQPYIDEGGTHILMCTYSSPVIVNGKMVAVFFVDVPLKEVSILSENINSGISRSAIITIFIQLLSMLLLGFIIWRAVTASRNYKEKVVDSEKNHLSEQLAKLREVNSRLTKRNQELAEKNMQLQRQLQSGYQTTSTGPASYV